MKLLGLLLLSPLLLPLTFLLIDIGPKEGDALLALGLGLAPGPHAESVLALELVEDVELGVHYTCES